MSVDEKIVNQPYHIFRLKRRGIWKVKDIFGPVWNVSLLIWRTPEQNPWEYLPGYQNPGEKDEGLMIYIHE